MKKSLQATPSTTRISSGICSMITASSHNTSPRLSHSTKKRRMSVDDSVAQLITRIHSSMDRLAQIWDAVGMDQKSRDCRIQTAYIHFYTLLDDIVKAEEDMASGVASDIEARRLAVADLRTMFQMPKFNEDRYGQGAISLLKALDKELNSLSKKRDEAVARQVQEYEEVRELCFRLDIQPPVYKDISFNIMTKAEFKKLENYRKELCQEVNQKMSKAVHLQLTCQKMYQAVRKFSACSAEEENLLIADFTANFSVVSDAVLQALQELQQQLETEYTNWVEQISFQYTELVIQLKELSNKCGGLENSLTYPPHFDVESQSEKDVTRLAEEVDRLQKRYHKGQLVFDKLSIWMDLWKEKLQLERQASSASIYNNRGGQLNVFLKRKKQVAVSLPIALKELKQTLKVYLEEEGNELADVLVEGMLPDEYAQFLVSEHEERKELIKASKQQESSAKYGISTFKSPAKKTGPAVNIHRSASRPRIDANKVLSGKIGKKKRSMSCSSLLSIISPVKKISANGPKTSSPKFLLSAGKQQVRKANLLPTTPCSMTPNRRKLVIDHSPAVGTPVWKY